MPAIRITNIHCNNVPCSLVGFSTCLTSLMYIYSTVLTLKTKQKANHSSSKAGHLSLMFKLLWGQIDGLCMAMMRCMFIIIEVFDLCVVSPIHHLILLVERMILHLIDFVPMSNLCVMLLHRLITCIGACMYQQLHGPKGMYYCIHLLLRHNTTNLTFIALCFFHFKDLLLPISILLYIYIYIYVYMPHF